MTETKMTHCPKCHKPLMTGGQFSSWAQFTIRCAWCQAVTLIIIQPSINVSLKNSEALIQNDFEQPSQQFIFNGMADGKSSGNEKVGSSQPMSNDGIKVVGYLYPQDKEEKSTTF